MQISCLPNLLLCHTKRALDHESTGAAIQPQMSAMIKTTCFYVKAGLKKRRFFYVNREAGI